MPARSVLLAALLLAGSAIATPALSQTLTDRISRSARAESGQQDRMLVDADQMQYDRNANTITAVGSVQIYYQGRILQADKVVYNQDTKRVFAEGNAKLTERDGSVAYSDRFELSDDFREGFVDSLRTVSADDTRFNAERAERIGGETTVFVNGEYTACPECKTDPSRPPLWRVKAKKIIHNNSEQTVYYEDATFELFGMPIAWLPYFSTPDPSVKRKSGVLAPRYVASNNLGAGVAVPLFFALAPNYDLTVTPTFLSRQGVLGIAEWRHRLMNGSYSIRASGIFQQDPGAFQPAPYGPGSRDFRGSIETKGQFNINTQWKLGWDVTVMSDRWFTRDYKLPNAILAQNFFREAISTVFLTGQGERGYFDLRGYYFRGLSASDLQEQLPVVGPLIDYNKTFDIPADRTWGIGGQAEIDFNFTNVTRDLAAFESIGARQLDKAYNLYDVCAPGLNGLYYPSNCLIRGMAGNYARASAQASWKRNYIDPIGQVWTPFAFANFNGSWLKLDTTGSMTFSSNCLGCLSTINNASQLNFFGQDDSVFRGQLLPGAGVEYRFPFIARTNDVSHVVEPIAQIVTRPAAIRSRTLVNEDAQSLVFDDTNLFAWSKYSGYDRIEGGTRANYGAQYTATFDRGGYASMMVGQSYQLVGPNSYANPDVANTGLQSGLNTEASDYIARAAFAPNSTYSFVAKARFDVNTFDMRRFDLAAHANWGKIEATLLYANYDAQPLIGYYKPREGFGASTKLKFTENWFVNGSIIVDMSRQTYTPINSTAAKQAPLFSVAGLGLGAGYTDECTTLAVTYTSILQENTLGYQERNQTVALQLQLRTLGDARVRSGLDSSRLQDGLASGNAR
ncbi:MAG: LPS-assembly protein LptD [Beijerinckiaceae bacterium]